MPKLSIIIPVYNEEKYISQCLDSALRQSLKEIEVLCVDDGSTDGSKNILKSYQKGDPRVHVLEHSNRGSGIARNRGVKSASGEYVAFLDADDYYCTPDALECLYKVAKNNEALIAGGIQLFDLSANAVPRSSKITDCPNGGRFYSYEECQISLGYQPFIFSRKMLLEHSIAFPPYLRFQDPPFFARALFAAKRFYFLPKSVHVYRLGHKIINWNFEKVNDLVKGLTDNLSFSAEHDLAQLHRETLEYFDMDYFSVILDSLIAGNKELLSLLLKTDSNVKTGLLGCTDSGMSFNLQVLNYIVMDTPEDPLTKLASSEKIIYYGAGNKGRRMIAQAEALSGRPPDMIWDVNAQSIGTIEGLAVSMPDFSLMRDGWALIICVENPVIARSVRLSCEAYRFYNVFDWSLIQRAWLNQKFKSVIQSLRIISAIDG